MSNPIQLSFKNTAIAFRHKTDAELKKAHIMFRAMGINWFVNAGPGILKIAFALGLRRPVSWVIKQTIFQQFCGGETMDECVETAKKLKKSGIGTILDYSVEGEEKNEVFDATRDEIIRTINMAAKHRDSIPFSVFKVTGVAAQHILEKVSDGKIDENTRIEWNKVSQRVEDMCKAAFNQKVRLFIDAEESWLQPAIDQICEDMMEKYNKTDCYIYNTVQLYRTDRLDYTKKLYEKACQKNYKIGLKLVRGAYMEKERDRAKSNGYVSPIQPDKSASDRDYDATMKFCFDHLDSISLCAGTHNEESSYLLVQWMNEKGIEKNDPRIYFSQLLGMSDHISYNLAEAGYNVAKYVPYGPVKAVIPYLIRRAQENSSAKGQAGRELTLIRAELERRKNM